jgi:hypothetical protein
MFNVKMAFRNRPVADIALFVVMSLVGIVLLISEMSNEISRTNNVYFKADTEIYNFIEGFSVENELRNRHNLVPVRGMGYYDFVLSANPRLLEDIDTPVVHIVEDIFFSPLVVYSWKNISRVLEIDGVVRSLVGERNAFAIDIDGLIELILAGKTWADLGVENLPRTIQISTTCIRTTEQGRLFVGLLALALNDYQTVEMHHIDGIIDDLTTVMRNVDFSQTDSNALFQSLIRLGFAERPIVVLFETQVASMSQDFSIQSSWWSVRDDVVMFYPTPTVIGSYYLASFSDRGNQVVDAFMGRGSWLRQGGWWSHALRETLASGETTFSFDEIGIKPAITSVIQTPNDTVMEAILTRLELRGI